MAIPEQLGNLVILLSFILPPIVAVLKGYLGLDKKRASIAVIVLCLVFGVIAAILMGQLEVGEAIVTMMWEVLNTSVYIMLVAYAFYKLFYQALGLDDWIVAKTSPE